MKDKEEIAAEAYQVIGELARAGGLFDTDEVQDALTYFSNHACENECSEDEILPFYIDNTVSYDING